MAEYDYVHHLKELYDCRKAERATWEQHWEELAEFVSPRKMGFTGLRQAGEKRMQRVFDATAIQANMMLAAGLHGMATNPASKWFALRVISERIVDENGEDVDINEVPLVRKWLSDVEGIIWQRIYQPGVGFSGSVVELYQDLACFGTGIMFIGQRKDGGLLMQTRSLAECLIDENADGEVDTVMRSFHMTVRQMMQMARDHGWQVSERVRKLYDEKKYDEKIRIIHSVHPREDRDPTKKGPRHMPWASCYFEHEDCNVLEESGFPEFPYVCPRWSKVAGETYGRSPAMTALPDIKMLQAMALTMIKAGQKCADPPLWLRDDGVIGGTRTVPGGINYWRGNPNEGVMLMPTPDKLPWVKEDMEQLRNSIRNSFHVDVLQMVDEREMTLGEARMRLMERMRLMGPLVARLESEFLGPLVTRVMGILTRQGLIPPPPPIIEDREYVVEFISPIAQAQKQQEANGLMQVFQYLAPLGEQGMAALLQRKINPDKLVDWLWNLFNVDPDLLNSDEEIAAMEQRAQQMQAVAAAQPAADALQKGAGAVKALADANASGGVDLGGLVGQVAQNVQSDPRLMRQLREQLSLGGGGSSGLVQ